MLAEENWPLLTVAKGAFDTLGKDTGLATAAALLDETGEATGGWEDDGELEIDECECTQRLLVTCTIIIIVNCVCGFV